MKSCSPVPLWPSEQCYYLGWEAAAAAAAGVPCPGINSLQHLESWLPYKLSVSQLAEISDFAPQNVLDSGHLKSGRGVLCGKPMAQKNRSWREVPRI